MKRPFTDACVAAAALCAALPATALAGQEQPSLDDLGYEPIVTVESASRLEHRIVDSPAPATVISREQIRASGARDLPELMRFAPGFLTGAYSGRTRAVTSHGLADQYARRMQVLVDGRVVYSPAVGGVQWADLNLHLDDIERIEVIRTANAVTYGANSFLGVINILTRAPAEDHGVEAGVTIGGDDHREASLRIGGRLGGGERGADYRLRLHYRDDEGFEEAGGLDLDGKESAGLNGRIDWRGSGDGRWQLHFGANRGDRRDGVPGDPLDPIRAKEMEGYFALLKHRRPVGEKSRIKAALAHTVHRTADPYLSDPIAPLGGLQLPIDLTVTSRRTTLELAYETLWSADTRTVFGGEVRRDAVKSLGYLNSADYLENDLLRLFASAEWHPLEDWTVHGGAMAEHFDISGTTLSPRLALNRLLGPDSSLRASASRAYRAPILFEEYADARVPVLGQVYGAAGGLEPARITTVELGYVRDWSLTPWRIDARLYHDRLERLIMAVTRGGLKGFENAESAEINGAELQLGYRFNRHGQLLFNYSYADAEASDRTDQLSASVPRHTLSLFAMGRLGGFDLSAGYHYVDEMRYLNEGEYLPPIHRLDARLARDFQLGAGQELELALSLQNLLDDHPDFLLTNDTDRRVYLTATLRF